MAILKVARLGHPVLRRIADPIPPDAIASAPVQALIDDLLETVDEYDGAGLAAPQVHASVRILVLALDDEGMRVWINPVLTPLTVEQTTTVEGCLSVPGLRGRVSRPSAVRVEALDRDGQPVRLELQGFPAVVAQHECDHLDGVLYVDKVEPRSLMFLEEFRRYALHHPEGPGRVGTPSPPSEPAPAAGPTPPGAAAAFEPLSVGPQDAERAALRDGAPADPADLDDPATDPLGLDDLVASRAALPPTEP